MSEIKRYYVREEQLFVSCPNPKYEEVVMASDHLADRAELVRKNEQMETLCKTIAHHLPYETEAYYIEKLNAITGPAEGMHTHSMLYKQLGFCRTSAAARDKCQRDLDSL